MIQGVENYFREVDYNIGIDLFSTSSNVAPAGKLMKISA